MKIEISTVAIDAIVDSVFRYKDPITDIGVLDTKYNRETVKKIIIEEITSKFDKKVLFIDHLSIVQNTINKLIEVK